MYDVDFQPYLPVTDNVELILNSQGIDELAVLLMATPWRTAPELGRSILGYIRSGSSGGRNSIGTYWRSTGFGGGDTDCQD